MSSEDSPMVSPAFTGRQWNASSYQRDFRRSPAALAPTPMPLQQGSINGMESPDACVLCSPPFGGLVMKSPLGRVEDDNSINTAIKMECLRANTWLSPTIQNPETNRMVSTAQLAGLQASPRLVESTTTEEKVYTEKEIEDECEVMAAISSHLDDEEAQEKELQEMVQCGTRAEDSDSDTFDFSVIGDAEMANAVDEDNFYKFGTPLPFKLASGSYSSESTTKASSRTDGSSSAGSSVKTAEKPQDVTYGSKLSSSGTEEARKDHHWQMASILGFAGFRCNCTIAQKRGALSCIERFGKEQFRRWHNETYFMGAASKEEEKKTSLKDRVTTSIFTKMWNLKAPVTDAVGQDRYGRKFTIPRWMLDGHEVCRSAWILLVGGSSKKHRTLYTLVCSGHGPTDLDAKKLTKTLLDRLEARTDANGTRDNERRGFAANWWKNYLLVCDFLPNEERIQIRGPPDSKLHEQVYKPAAIQAGLYLGKSSWKTCAREGLRLVAALLPGADPNKLKASRAARHSKFPECQKCQDKRKAWMDACQNLSSDKEWVKFLYEDMLEHQKEWSADRATALAIRRSLFTTLARAIYECDDKCGSWWQAMPVDPTGREGKHTSPYQFHFSIQANVVCGQEGVLRFAMVPKFLSTGGNFGLTNLVMVLYRAMQRGRLQPHVRTMYRHTVCMHH